MGHNCLGGLLHDRGKETGSGPETDYGEDDALQCLLEEGGLCFATEAYRDGSVRVPSLCSRVQDRNALWPSAATGVAVTFQEASQFVLPYGSHKGRTIDGVASTDKGLRDLDSFLAWLETNRPGTDVHEAVRLYLDDPTIRKELESL